MSTDVSALTIRRKRLLYRSLYRGNRENDILLGQFALAYIDGFDDRQLDQLEHLLELPDNDIFDWLAGRSDTPPEEDTTVLRLLKAFQVRF